MVQRVFYQLCPSRLASRIHPLSLSRILVTFSVTCIFHSFWKKNSICGVHILRRFIESMRFYSCPNFPLKTSCRIFRNPFSPKQKKMEKTIISLINNESENLKITCNFKLFIFYFICSFSKCDGFTAL